MILFRKAVLIIHGFAGGTYDEEKLSNVLERNWNLDVYSFTLPGHERRELKSVKYKDWIDSCKEMVERLISYGYRKIYVVGHSMGGILATYIANNYKEVKKLVLIAPAFQYFMGDDSKPIDNLKSGVKMLKENSMSEVVNRIFKLPVKSFNEFISFRDKYKEEYLKINVPLLYLQGDKDTVVPYKKSKQIFDSINYKNKKFVKLVGSSHNVFDSYNCAANSEIETFLRK